MADPGLPDSVVEFKQRFYPNGRARYDLTKPGTRKLVPQGQVLTFFRSDYRAMENMIFGEVPDFEEILAVLQALKEETNTPSGKMAAYFSRKF